MDHRLGGQPVNLALGALDEGAGGDENKKARVAPQTAVRVRRSTDRGGKSVDCQSI